MSFALYNKMKTIESSRRELKNILTNKGLDTGRVEALGSLVGMVGQLEKPVYETPIEDIWEGVIRVDEPIDYYTGDDDWKSVIDLHAIMEADSTSYTRKAIFLIRVSDNPEPSIILSTSTGSTSSSVSVWNDADILNLTGVVCKFSDSTSTTTIAATTTHTWDKNKDIVAENGERFRYIIFYSNSNINLDYITSKVCFEAVYFHQGSFGTISMLGAGGARRYESTSNPNNTIATPKFIELNANASISTLRFKSIYSNTITIYKSRIRTLLLYGNITTIQGSIYGKNLEFVKYTGTSKPTFEFVDISNNDINTYIYLKNSGTLAVRYSNNVNIYADSVSTISASNHNNNVKFSLKTNGSTSIAANAFATTNNNVDIDLQDVGTIGEAAFLNFNQGHLKIGKINGNVNSYAFYGSCLHQDVIFGSGCSSIRNAIFAFCNITSIDLSNSSITALPQGSDFEIANRADNNNSGDGNNAGGGSSSNVLQNIGGAFRFLYTLKSLKLPTSLKTINNYAVRDCKELEYIEIPEGLTTIGTYAFMNCEKLPAINLPDTVISLGTGAFANCKSLHTIKLSNNLISLPSNAFEGCNSLLHVALPSNLATLGTYSFSNCKAIQYIDLPSGILTIPERCFNGCSSLKKITCVEGTINTLKAYAFADCENLEEIFDISEVLTAEIGVFMNCKKLHIKCPRAMIAADVNMFAGNYNFIDFSEFESCNITTLNLRGSSWTMENILKFLYKLPDRTEKTKHTLKMGPSFARLQWAQGATNGNTVYYIINTDATFMNYEESIYPNYAADYVLDDGEKLIWSDSSTEGAVTVADYVASKNWTIT